LIKFAVTAKMMKNDLTTIIRGLLFRHDCVIIPGFGGFILNYVPAFIDKSTGTFNPPARRVSFNRNLTHNDGLLIGSVSSEEEVNYGEAREMVEKYVSDIRRTLSRGAQVDLEYIGVFHVNKEGSIQFEPDRNANYNLGSYGMESFRYEPVAGYDVRKKVLRARHEAYPQGVRMRKMLVRAAVAVPVLIALIAVPLKTDLLGTRLNKASLNPLAKAELENNKEAIDDLPQITLTDRQTDSSGTISGEPEALTSGEAQELNSAERQPLVSGEPEAQAQGTAGSTAVPVPDAQPGFFLIAGSFKSAENAQVMAGQLRNIGYEPILMDAPNGYTRVAAKGFTIMESALSEKEKLSASFSGLWILKMQ
jgi:nucleoid DNA-binding protein